MEEMNYRKVSKFEKHGLKNEMRWEWSALSLK